MKKKRNRVFFCHICFALTGKRCLWWINNLFHYFLEYILLFKKRLFFPFAKVIFVTSHFEEWGVRMDRFYDGVLMLMICVVPCQCLLCFTAWNWGMQGKVRGAMWYVHSAERNLIVYNSWSRTIFVNTYFEFCFQTGFLATSQNSPVNIQSISISHQLHCHFCIILQKRKQKIWSQVLGLIKKLEKFGKWRQF